SLSLPQAPLRPCGERASRVHMRWLQMPSVAPLDATASAVMTCAPRAPLSQAPTPPSPFCPDSSESVNDVPSMGTKTRCWARHRCSVAVSTARRTSCARTLVFSRSRNAPSRDALVRHALVTSPAGLPAASAASVTSRLVRRRSPSSACPNSSSAHFRVSRIHGRRAQSPKIQGKDPINAQACAPLAPPLLYAPSLPPPRPPLALPGEPASPAANVVRMHDAERKDQDGFSSRLRDSEGVRRKAM